MLMMLRYRPPRPDRAAILYRRFVKRIGVEPLVGETPTRYAMRAAAKSAVPAAIIDSITANYLDARYGSTSPEALSKLELAIDQL